MRNSSLDEFVGGADGDESDAERADGETADPGGEGDTEPEPDPDSEAEPDPDSEAEPDPDSETESESEPATGTDQGEENRGGRDGDTAEAAVEPAVSMMDWTPDGAACAKCQEPSERRWRDDGDLVCSSCKTW